jgi:hypothetical protein
MELAAGRWHRLTPNNIAALPNADGVFEVANLVRNVQFVGRGRGRLRETVAAFGHMPRALPLSVGGYFFRFELTTAEGETWKRRIEAYRKRHDGALPPGNAGDILEALEAPKPAAPAPKPTPAARPVEAQQAA